MKKLFKNTILAGTALGIGAGFAAPAVAQEATVSEAADIVVTARRTEERLQDVPIAITVLNQEQLSNANVTTAADLSRSVPGLVSNERFGSDNSSFTIRGFTQELRTTASVGTYFADVVAPRGATPITSGDGAGPGAFFDLANVQVLKGPQGTLFGRNTTGGAVLLVPQRPTDEFGGYVEGTVGNYNQERIQGVLNVPISDAARLRFGADHNQRDGYLNNVSPIGPDDFGDVNYTALRASMVLDLTPTLENYTVLSYSDSDTNGSTAQLFACSDRLPPSSGGFRLPVNQMCNASLPSSTVRPAVAGPPAYVSGNELAGNYYDVQNSIPDARSEVTNWQAINTTTWEASDNLTIKNIFAFANLEQTLVSPVVGTEWQVGDIDINPVTGAAWAVSGPQDSPYPYIQQMSGVRPGEPNVSQNSIVEELQFQGNNFDGRLTWQAGAYYEHSEPDAMQGGRSIGGLSCDYSALFGAGAPGFGDLASAGNICADTNFQALLAGGFPASSAASQSGVVNDTRGWTEFENRALYAQATFDFTEQLSLTAGYRYTWDRTTGQIQSINYFFNDPALSVQGSGNASAADDLTDVYVTRCNDVLLQGNPATDYDASDPNTCTLTGLEQESNAPTWLLGLDFHVTPDNLLYAKYARGYRQGGVNISGLPGAYTYEPEQVDTYEIGSKNSFGGPIPGIFNVALFYNDFSDQQVQFGVLPLGGVGTTAIVNAGATTIYGLDLDASFELFEGFTLSGSYSYLNTSVDDLAPSVAPNFAPIGAGGCSTGTTGYQQFLPFPGPDVLCVRGGVGSIAEGGVLNYAPEQQGSLTATYRLPTPDYVGDVTISATYNYSAEYQVALAQNTPYAVVPAYSTVNLNLNWEGIAGGPVDGAVFVTNLLDEESYSYVAGQYVSSGFESRALGQPFMAGARLRYRFGGES